MGILPKSEHRYTRADDEYNDVWEPAPRCVDDNEVRQPLTLVSILPQCVASMDENAVRLLTVQHCLVRSPPQEPHLPPEYVRMFHDVVRAGGKGGGGGGSLNQSFDMAGTVFYPEGGGHLLAPW